MASYAEIMADSVVFYNFQEYSEVIAMKAIEINIASLDFLGLSNLFNATGILHTATDTAN